MLKVVFSIFAALYLTVRFLIEFDFFPDLSRHRNIAIVYMVQEYSSMLIFVYMNFYIYFTGLGVVSVMAKEGLVDTRKAHCVLTVFITASLLTWVDLAVNPIITLLLTEPDWTCSDKVQQFMLADYLIDQFLFPMVFQLVLILVLTTFAKLAVKEKQINVSDMDMLSTAYDLPGDGLSSINNEGRGNRFASLADSAHRPSDGFLDLDTHVETQRSLSMKIFKSSNLKQKQDFLLQYAEKYKLSRQTTDSQQKSESGRTRISSYVPTGSMKLKHPIYTIASVEVL